MQRAKPAKLATIGTVRMLSGTAMSRKATTGTQSDIEDRDHDADAFGAEPVEPAEREFALLVAGQPAGAGQEAAPVLLDDLEAAIGPAVALLLVGLEGVGQQAVAVAPVGVMRLPAELEHASGRDRCPRRSCRSTSRRPTSSAARRIRHMVPCTMMALASLRCDHADVEEAGIFAVHGVMHEAALAVAMILRRLHQADLRDRRRAAPDP